MPGSGTVLYSDLWTKDECRLHINVLELRAVHLTLHHLEKDVLGEMILIKSDNMATVSYINRQGEWSSRPSTMRLALYSSG